MTACGHDQALERFRIIQPFLEEGVALAAIAQNHRIPYTHGTAVGQPLSHRRSGRP